MLQPLRRRIPIRSILLISVGLLGGVLLSGFATATTEKQSAYEILRQLARVLVLVENKYVEPVDRQRLLEGAVKGMVAELDPHSSYLPARDYTVFQADTKGEFGGIGVEVDFRNDVVTIISPIDGSPAERAGIVPGDQIVAIDQMNVRGKTAAELVKRMRGKPGSTVVVTIRRRDREKLLSFTLTREVIDVASVGTKSLAGNIAYIRLKQFQSGTHTELLEAIAKLRAEQPVEGVILDLRNNPGGLVHEATAIADEFLKQGVVYTTRHRGKVMDTVEASSGGALADAPLVVLVNEYSASASELVAGALQDHGRGSVIGAPTFGKGSVQSILDLPGGAGLRLTTMRYYTPGGRAIQAQGIRPDVQVEAAYIADTSFGVTRESDLENHLPAEGAPKTSEKQKPAVLRAPKSSEEEVGVSPTHLGVARVIPRDPSGGPDFALSIGYQIVRGILTKQK